MVIDGQSGTGGQKEIINKEIKDRGIGENIDKNYCLLTHGARRTRKPCNIANKIVVNIIFKIPS